MRYRAVLLTCVLVLACNPDSPTTLQDPQAAPEMDAGESGWPPHLRNLPGIRLPSWSPMSPASLRTGIRPSQSLAAVTPAFSPPIDLGLSVGGTAAAAIDVNAAGQVAGYYSGGGVRWAPDGSAEPVPGSAARAINASGQMAMEAGYRYDGPGSLTPLSVPPDFTEAIPNSVTDDGRLVGATRDIWGDHTPVLWAADGSGSILSAPPITIPWDINEAGEVVGYTLGLETGSEALVWAPDGSYTILPKLESGQPPVPSRPEGAIAWGQNNSGTIVGSQEGPYGTATPLRWQNGEVSALEKPGDYAWAFDVNEAGLIAGAYSNPPGSPQAVVWAPDGTLLAELPGLCEGCVTAAEAIEGNYVAGWGTNANGQTTALLWTLPDPGATGTGTDVAVAPIDPATNTSPATLTFGHVTTAGATTVSSTTQGPTLPLGFHVGDTPVYYELTTTAAYSGSITVCFTYDPAAYQSPNVRLLHGEAGVWTDVTTSRDESAHIICGTTTSLSPFIMAEFHYDFTGFFQPVDNGKVGNVVKAGSGIPVKFSLGGALGLDVLMFPPSSTAISCDAAPVMDDIEATTTNPAGLTYDAAAKQYVYVWKTKSEWKGTCRRFMLDLKDGTQHTALFQFK